MNRTLCNETRPAKSRLPNLKEQDSALLVAQAARAFERTGERFRLLPGSHMDSTPLAGGGWLFARRRLRCISASATRATRNLEHNQQEKIMFDRSALPPAQAFYESEGFKLSRPNSKGLGNVPGQPAVPQSE